MSDKELGIATQAVHAGEVPNPETGASGDLVMSSTFVSKTPGGFSIHDADDDAPFIYGRWGNPTVRVLEDKVAALEGTQKAAAYGSGMAAAAAIFFTHLSAGDHLIVSDISYAGVAELVRDTLPRFGINVTCVDLSDLDAVRAAIRPETKLIHAETPVNPIMRLADLPELARIAKAAGALLSCDSTFQSPIACKPAALGVDLVMHSATKYLCGHGDAVGGIVCGSKELIDHMIKEASVHYGGVMSPFNAWLITRGIATLPMRMKAHEAGALQIANWLEDHPNVTSVLYPGLPNHPQHELAKAQMANFSGMLSFQVGDAATGVAIAERMIERFEHIHYAVSLGHHRTLIYWMPTADLLQNAFRGSEESAAAYRAAAGEGVFRLSVGLEDPADLIADLDRALTP